MRSVILWGPGRRAEGMNESDGEAGTGKLWGGRFGEATDAFIERFTASVGFDSRLWRHDIAGSIAHATMLAEADVLTEGEARQIVAGLEAIRCEIEQGRFAWSVELEDVHMNIEAALTERIGEVGKKLHTGRSRNDQVATDLRLYARGELDELRGLLWRLRSALVELAEREAGTIMPGFTHLQSAQPVTFGHHMLAWQEMLSRDDARLADCRRRINVSPLGAAALAGTSYPVNPARTAELLGFDAAAGNSLDAVSDRDFVIELAAAGSLLMVHLSRMSEELVLWMSAQFGFVDLPDRFCTGSSIMPQKKNPDVPELVRGKSGRVVGHLLSLLTLMKSQPLAYNKDNQEDKEPIFDTLDTLKDCVFAFSELVPAIECRREAMREAAGANYATATDLADYLVRKGLPFRDAHGVTGKAVAHAIGQGKKLAELSLPELRSFSGLIEANAYEVLSVEGSVAARNHPGGTAPTRVRQAAAAARKALAAEASAQRDAGASSSIS